MMNKNLQAYKELHHQVCHNQMIAASQFSHSQPEPVLCNCPSDDYHAPEPCTKPAAIPADMICILSKEYQAPPPPVTPNPKERNGVPGSNLTENSPTDHPMEDGCQDY
jgi:hypothetical protein